MEPSTFSPIHIGWAEVLARAGMAVVLPLLIGLERFLRHKPVDFRPFVIISISACGLTLGGMELAQRGGNPQLTIDPTRIFAGVITGIGFLGAGAIFREGNHVLGGGSAAAIWATGAIGILCGVGMLWLAVLIAATVLCLLLVSEPLISRTAAPEDSDADPNAHAGDGV